MSGHDIANVSIHRLPLIGLPGMECGLPIDKDGRCVDENDEPLPLEGRSPCGADGAWTVGQMTLCDAHFRVFCRLTEIDYDGILAEWKGRVMGTWDE
jgi:hypothetical protein